MKGIIVVLAVMHLSGCIGQGNWGESAGFSQGKSMSQAAMEAAKSPQTWVPLVTAGVLVVADVDEQWSEDLYQDQPLFGDDAQSVSSDLRDIASGAYVLTALLAPSPTVGAKMRGLAVGAGTAVLDGVVNEGLKDLTQRERPDGSNDNSMPSGHASKAASRTYMARYNLRHIDMPEWSRQVANWGLHGVAIGTGLARVEAGKHHLSDVLVGYALGNFVAQFMQFAFLDGRDDGTQITFDPVERGGVLTLSMPVR